MYPEAVDRRHAQTNTSHDRAAVLGSAASTTSGPDGDRLAQTTFIQRVATTGGLAPAAGECEAGAQVEVPYTADYYFWKAR